jgi:hypothetical protein
VDAGYTLSDDELPKPVSFDARYGAGVERLRSADNARPETIRAIGHAALAARTPGLGAEGRLGRFHRSRQKSAESVAVARFGRQDGAMGERTFDYSELVDELRCHTTEWLEAARVEAVREQRRWRVRELAITRVLDERGRVDDTRAAEDGVSVRDVREFRETARLLDELPEIAKAAHDGELSDDQLAAVTRLAEPDDDAEWAQRARNCSPEDLQRLVRCKRTPTAEEGRARRQARSLGFWWRTDDTGMLDGRFSLPDVDGALFERVLNQMIDEMKPAKGQPWETRARRGADALVELVRNYAHVEAPSGPDPYFVVHVPPDGPAEVAGIPLPDEMVEALRASAKVEPVLVDQTGAPLTRGRTRTALPPKVVRGVRLRDGKCRWPGCDRRTGLQVHHLWPVSWGGSDEQSNLALVCVGGGTDHHGTLAPHGGSLLLGNPNQPDGLHIVRVEQLADLADLADLAELAADHARTKPEAA